MKPKLVTLACFGLAIITLTAGKSNPSNDDPEKLKNVLNNFFQGVATQDFEKLKVTTTSDFILYEDGRLWNIDSAFMNIRNRMPYTVKFQMDNLKFFVDRESGDVTYTNHGDFVFNNAEKLSLDWVESATFRKINGIWKINFLQATVRK
ncbi:MAG TPA: nuclear transport factor 2 family protein [Puia sp.]